MFHRRTVTHATRLFALAALIALLPLTATSPVYADGAWTNQAPTTYPPARYYHAMASLGGDQVLLFGGEGASGRLGDTWVYDLSANTWTQGTTDGPSARMFHAMARIGGDQVLLFGGYAAGASGETWVYDLSDNTWTNQAPTASPPPRFRHAMAWLDGDQVLLFGGYDYDSDPFGDTWVYDLSDNAWTQKAPAQAPSARYYHAMASLGGGQVLLFGGYSVSGYSNATWVYDLSANTWTNQVPSTAPSYRRGHAMASLSGGQVLLFGGYDEYSEPALFDDTWVYDLGDNTWAEQTPAAAPSAREGHAIASPGAGQALLFGGWDTNYDDETWLAAGFFSGTLYRIYLPLLAR